jgi:hypothetical protein
MPLEAEKVHFSQVKFSSLLTNHKQTHTNSRACLVSDRCGVSETFLEWEMIYSQVATLIFK